MASGPLLQWGRRCPRQQHWHPVCGPVSHRLVRSCSCRRRSSVPVTVVALQPGGQRAVDLGVLRCRASPLARVANSSDVAGLVEAPGDLVEVLLLSRPGQSSIVAPQLSTRRWVHPRAGFSAASSGSSTAASSRSAPASSGRWNRSRSETPFSWSIRAATIRRPPRHSATAVSGRRALSVELLRDGVDLLLPFAPDGFVAPGQ